MLASSEDQRVPTTKNIIMATLLILCFQFFISSEQEQHVEKCQKLNEKARECKFCWTTFDTFHELFCHHRVDGCPAMKAIHYITDTDDAMSNDQQFLIQPIEIEIKDSQLINIEENIQKPLDNDSKSHLIECKPCNLTFQNTDYIQHKFENHSLFMEYECHVCKRKFPNLSTQRLVNRFRLKTAIRCKICWLIIQRQTKNVSQNTGWIRTLCHICGVFIKSGNIYRHMNKIHSKNSIGRQIRLPDSVLQKLQCPECDTSFIYKSRYNLHIRFEHPEKYKQIMSESKPQPLRCLFCGKILNTKKELKEHRLTHKKFQCEICKKYCGSKETYESHVKNHSKHERPFICQVSWIY